MNKQPIPPYSKDNNKVIHMEQEQQKKCKCYCHDHPEKPFEHDFECCGAMNGTVEHPQPEKCEHTPEWNEGNIGECIKCVVLKPTKHPQKELDETN